MTTLPDVLTPEEAADVLRLPVGTVRAALRRGEIPGARVCNRWRILRRDLDALFAAAPRAPVAPTAEHVEPILVTSAPPTGIPGRPPRRRRGRR